MSDIRAVQIEHLKKLGYRFEEKDIPLPDENKLKLGVAILVDYKTPIDEQCQKLSIKNWLEVLRHENRYSVPNDHWGWIYGVIILVTEVSMNMSYAKQVTGAHYYCITVEGLALYRENPELFKNRIVNFRGSAYKAGGWITNDDPSLEWVDGDPVLSYGVYRSHCPLVLK